MATTVRIWAAAGAVAVTLLAGATPAGAAGTPLPWTMAPCVTVGAMRQAEFDDWNFNVLVGSATQCGPVVAGGGFRIAEYSPAEATGYAWGYNVRLFASASVGSVRDFGVSVPGDDGEHGLCVIAGASRRIGCFRLQVSHVDRTFINLVSPLSPNDPLVAKPIVTTPYTGALAPGRDEAGNGPRPACGTCF